MKWNQGQEEREHEESVGKWCWTSFLFSNFSPEFSRKLAQQRKKSLITSIFSSNFSNQSGKFRVKIGEKFDATHEQFLPRKLDEIFPK